MPFHLPTTHTSCLQLLSFVYHHHSPSFPHCIMHSFQLPHVLEGFTAFLGIDFSAFASSSPHPETSFLTMDFTTQGYTQIPFCPPLAPRTPNDNVSTYNLGREPPIALNAEVALPACPPAPRKPHGGVASYPPGSLDPIAPLLFSMNVPTHTPGPVTTPRSNRLVTASHGDDQASGVRSFLDMDGESEYETRRYIASRVAHTLLHRHRLKSKSNSKRRGSSGKRASPLANVLAVRA